MKLLHYSDRNFNDHLKHLRKSSSLFDKTIETQTASVIEAIQERGDKALLEFIRRFDGVQLTASQLAVTTAELVSASLKATAGLRASVSQAGKNIGDFSRRSLRKDWSFKNIQGAKVGEKFDPIQRVGVYIPGGTAPLVSTALMTVTLARVAGCPEIVACTPCRPDGSVNPALLFAMRAAGATEIYRVGGSQAIAAMALGTESIRPVRKVFGPGNAYVVAAKRLLYGRVAVDLLPGPSEVLILADETACPAFAAADLLAQSEHGSGHERIWLVTTSGKLLAAVNKEIDRQLPIRGRREFIARVLRNNGWLIQVRSLAAGLDVVNLLAPEHCEIMTRKPIQVAKKIVTAGAIFIGPWSPTVLGDYIAGPSHTLPTGGAGCSFAGLTVDQFQRRTSIVEYGRAALKKSIKTIEEFARVEGLEAHGASASIRLIKPKSHRSKRRPG
jgi:histidinol dehydrogenase